VKFEYLNELTPLPLLDSLLFIVFLPGKYRTGYGRQNRLSSSNAEFRD